MLKETINYTDFDGNDRTRVAYFHISKPELMELEASEKEGFSNILREIVETRDLQGLLSNFKKIIHLAYGVKSPDGDRFIKNEEVWEEFSQSGAYEELYMKLATNADYASHFVNEIIPDINEIIDQIKKNNGGELTIVP